MLTSLAMLRSRHLLSHITRVCMTLTFSSAVTSFGRPDRPSSSTLSLLLLNCAAFFSLWYKVLPNGFHEVFMNFLGRHSLFTEVLDNHSDFKFLHFANVSHPPLTTLYIKQPSMTSCFSHSQCPSIRSNDRLTKILIQ